MWTVGPDLAVADVAVLFLHSLHLESDSGAVPSLPHTGVLGITLSQFSAFQVCHTQVR